MLVFDVDVQSAQIALEDYLAAAAAQDSSESVGVDRAALARQIHHAKVFVCSVRRVGRLLEDFSANRSIFSADVADAIKLIWKRNRSFFERYREPRNSIEHIDGEIKGRTNWIMVNLVDDGLQVVPGKTAQVSDDAVERVLKARNEVVAAVMSGRDTS